MLKLYLNLNKSSSDVISLIAKDNNLTSYQVLKTSNGKPYFKDSKIYFNISNKDNITVGVSSLKRIGIDIEKITYKETVIKYFFNEKEQHIVNTSQRKDLAFTTIWVKKEAYLKCFDLDITSLRCIDTTRYQYIIKKYQNYIIGIIEESK